VTPKEIGRRLDELRAAGRALRRRPAAETLRGSAPEAFEFLSSVPLTFAAERNPQERFRARARVIATDCDGVVRGIRVNDRTQSQPDLDVEQVEPAYRALRKLYEIILAPENNFEHLLQPGEMALFDNHRVLHARRCFDPTAGERWIQQVSVDREEFHNRFRQLAESCDHDELSAWEPDAGALSQSRGAASVARHSSSSVPSNARPPAWSTRTLSASSSISSSR